MFQVGKNIEWYERTQRLYAYEHKRTKQALKDNGVHSLMGIEYGHLLEPNPPIFHMRVLENGEVKVLKPFINEEELNKLLCQGMSREEEENEK